jgi:hypothetical protein
MTLDDREQLFGDDSLHEAVWKIHQRRGEWPMWAQVVDELLGFGDAHRPRSSPGQGDGQRRDR